MTPSPLRQCIAATSAALAFGLAVVSPAAVADAGMKSLVTSRPFDETLVRLEKAIADNKMGLVAQASASKGAAARGVRIPGNAVLMVFRNDYAVRMLKASVPAGIEAPLRIYVTEDAAGTSIAYRSPSATFAPYGNAELDAMAGELDPIFDKIVADAAGR